MSTGSSIDNKNALFLFTYIRHVYVVYVYVIKKNHLFKI